MNDTMINVIFGMALGMSGSVFIRIAYQDYKSGNIWTKRVRFGLLMLSFFIVIDAAYILNTIPSIWIDELNMVVMLFAGMSLGATFMNHDNAIEAKQTKRDEHERIKRLMDYTEIDYTEGNEHDQNLHTSTNHTRTRISL